MSHMLKVLSAITATVMLPGCMSMYRGDTQGVWLLSDPPGAKVTLDDQTGTTPCILSLDRDSRPVLVRFQADGRAPVERTIAPQSDTGLLAFEFLIGCPPGAIFDCIAGNQYRWPLAFQATLAPAGGASTLAETWKAPLTPEQVACEQEQAAQTEERYRQGNRYTTQ